MAHDMDDVVDLDLDYDESELPEGDYPVRLIDIEKKTSKKGKPMLVFEFELREGGGDNTYKLYNVLTAKTATWTATRLRALGVEATVKDGKVRASFSIAGLVDSDPRVVATFEIEDYKGRPIARLKDIAAEE